MNVPKRTLIDLDLVSGTSAPLSLINAVIIMISDVDFITLR